MSQIATNTKGIRDIMRKDTGVDGDAQLISQMFFMKIFADKEEEWESRATQPLPNLPERSINGFMHRLLTTIRIGK